MKLILKQAVDFLGEAGDIVQVKAGFGRNYLIPQGLAYVASEANMAKMEAEQAKAGELARRDRLEASRRASQLEGLSLVFNERAGEDGKLFGSVTSADIADSANAGDLDFELERRTIVLDEPIKTIGVVSVAVKLHAEVESVIEVRVEKKKADSHVLAAKLEDFPPEVRRAAESALDLKAHDVVMLDLRGISTATDYFVVASGQSDVQVKAIAGNVVEELKKESHRPAHVEGMNGGRWVLVDYIDFVVHVFHPQARDFYQLENLWGDAPRWEAAERAE